MSQISVIGKRFRFSSSNSIYEFAVIFSFSISFHTTKAPQIKEIIWTPPNSNWVKGNCDGAYVHDYNKVACGGIFTYHKAHPISPPRSVTIESTPPSKEEISGSNIPSENYIICIKIDPPEVLAYYMEICLEDNIDPLVDPLNLPDDYPAVPPPPPPSRNP
ncbi:hypothetical protein KIW84_074703 [Lathyrus oleraceus]|uniref:Uncharacterized protein n=1 Tax=Pisum sativum TaxID=3888 RepID=A0A9D4VUM8_PEA|nr:hypothetical protein KIW84_074703 [Pisum sativum]